MRHESLVRQCVHAVLLLALPWTVAAQNLNDDFVLAAANDRVSEVKALLQRGLDPGTVDKNGDTALVAAARGGNAATVDVLLAARAPVNARTRFGDTAISLAALNGHLGVVRQLRAAGGEVNTPRTWTPLIYAATGGHNEVVLYLLKEGADINAESPSGTTALMMATREARFATVELLIAQRADPTGATTTG